MEDVSIWEKRKTKNGYDFYVHESKVERVAGESGTQQPGTKKERKYQIKILNPEEVLNDKRVKKSSVEIILGQDGELLGYIELGILDDNKTAVLGTRCQLLDKVPLPLEMEQYESIILDKGMGCAIFVNSECRR